MGDLHGILDLEVSATPIAVVDIETTGLSPGHDRIVEISVARVEPGEDPALVFDTLVNPLRPMAATEIHGITDEDVREAPTFAQIAGDFMRAISNSVVAAYNVYFDIGFLEYELNLSGIRVAIPHLCLMYMRPMLGIGARCPLDGACREHGVSFDGAHHSAADALASARLLEVYLAEIADAGIATFADLASLKNYKFVRSWDRAPVCRDVADACPSCGALKSRSTDLCSARPATAPCAAPPENPLAVYWEALKAALADLQITDEELHNLSMLKRTLGLHDEQVRVLHARVLTSVISQFTDDAWLDDKESRKLRRVYQCLSRLGWAPGE